MNFSLSKRLKLFKLKKIKSYLLYAVAEIVLVVLGILIALSIDNWNEERKDIAKEKNILIQLRDEYETNLTQLEEKIKSREDILKASHQVLKSIDNPEAVRRDTLVLKLVLLLNDPTFDPVVNDLFVSGNIRLIKNEELKKLLTNWSSEVIAVQEVEKRWAKLVDDVVAPHYIELGIARDALNTLYKSKNPAPFALEKSDYKLLLLGNSRKGRSTKEILSSEKLEGIMTVSIGLNNSANLQSEILKSRINKIIGLIDKELKSH